MHKHNNTHILENNIKLIEQITSYANICEKGNC